MFLKKTNIIFKIRRSKVTDYAALILKFGSITLGIFSKLSCQMRLLFDDRLKTHLRFDYRSNDHQK